jgi:hypothetical protein
LSTWCGAARVPAVEAARQSRAMGRLNNMGMQRTKKWEGGGARQGLVVCLHRKMRVAGKEGDEKGRNGWVG